MRISITIQTMGNHITSTDLLFRCQFHWVVFVHSTTTTKTFHELCNTTTCKYHDTGWMFNGMPILYPVPAREI